MHPQVLGRLREEILSMVGKDRAPSPGTLNDYPAERYVDLPCLDDLRGMKYLRAVLNETLRLFRYPPPPPGFPILYLTIIIQVPSLSTFARQSMAQLGSMTTERKYTSHQRLGNCMRCSSFLLLLIRLSA